MKLTWVDDEVQPGACSRVYLGKCSHVRLEA